jgi:TolA-binding protein
MKYRDKVIFGIFEDNPSFKIVQMRWYNGTAMLVNLQKTMLDKSFYADRPNQEFAPPETETDLQLSSVIQFEESTSPVEEESNIGETQVVSPESRLLDSFPLEDGRIALNANDERLTSYPLNLSAQSKGLIRAINKDILKPEDRKNKQTVYGVIPQIGDMCTVLVHRGVNNLFDYLWRYNRVHTAKRFFYTLMDPNEISLVNILNVNYDFPPEANILILYLGFEYKKGILVKNNAFIKSFPIQTASNLFTNRDEIYSKLMLEQDEAQLPDPQYIILAGENSKNDDVSYFQNKFPKSEVSRMFFKNMLVGEDAPDPITDEDLAEYAIPIALAWKTMDSGNKKFINTNFLQKKILEGQKIFKLAWHGFIILFLLFFYTSYSTKNFLIQSNELTHLKKSNVMLESELRSYRSKVESNMAGLLSVASLQGQQQKVLELLKGKNEWGYILNELANSVANHPMSWIINLKSEKETFTIIGKTTKRPNILAFSQLFPEGKILKVTNEKIGKILIWNFEMSFAYPKLETILKSQVAASPPNKDNASLAEVTAKKPKATEQPASTQPLKPEVKKAVTAKATEKPVVSAVQKANATKAVPKQAASSQAAPAKEVKKAVPEKVTQKSAVQSPSKQVVSQVAPKQAAVMPKAVPKQTAVTSPVTPKQTSVVPKTTPKQVVVTPKATPKATPKQVAVTPIPPKEVKKVTPEKVTAKKATPEVKKVPAPVTAPKQTVAATTKPKPEVKKTPILEKQTTKSTSTEDGVDKGAQEYEQLQSVYDKDNNEVVLSKAKQFVQKYPNHPYAYYSRYMMAESMYMLNDYKGALAQFDQIIAENKKKTADAYYMKGRCYLALKDTIRAKENFRYVMDRYPQSDVARKARKSMEVLP